MKCLITALKQMLLNRGFAFFFFKEKNFCFLLFDLRCDFSGQLMLKREKRGVGKAQSTAGLKH